MKKILSLLAVMPMALAACGGGGSDTKTLDLFGQNFSSIDDITSYSGNWSKISEQYTHQEAGNKITGDGMIENGEKVDVSTEEEAATKLVKDINNTTIDFVNNNYANYDKVLQVGQFNTTVSGGNQIPDSDRGTFTHLDKASIATLEIDVTDIVSALNTANGGTTAPYTPVTGFALEGNKITILDAAASNITGEPAAMTPHDNGDTSAGDFVKDGTLNLNVTALNGNYVDVELHLGKTDGSQKIGSWNVTVTDLSGRTSLLGALNGLTEGLSAFTYTPKKEHVRSGFKTGYALYEGLIWNFYDVASADATEFKTKVKTELAAKSTTIVKSAIVQSGVLTKQPIPGGYAPKFGTSVLPVPTKSYAGLFICTHLVEEAVKTGILSEGDKAAHIVKCSSITIAE